MARLSAVNSADAADNHTSASTNGQIKQGPPISRFTAISHDNDPSSDSYPISADPTLLPGGSRDLAFIGLQAFCLGLVTSAAVALTILLLYLYSPWWRLPAFFVCLGIFHFLEYWTTAAYNTPACRASSFILFNNGSAYTTAHTLAALEIVVSNFFPRYQAWGVWRLTMAAGVLLVVVGQVVRSVAMQQAGTNFNHLVQTERKRDHVLVTDGLYGYMRHPSYFGFFWWALGTQLLVGNKICLLGYLVVLWRFFYHRIRGEEAHLVSFFGDKYEDFRKHVGTKIPFIP